MSGRAGVNPGLLPAVDYDYHRAMVELEINQHFSAPPAKVRGAIRQAKSRRKFLHADIGSLYARIFSKST